MPLNHQRLIEAWNFIATHPEQHNQQYWADLRDVDPQQFNTTTGTINPRSLEHLGYDNNVWVGHLNDITCGTTACLAGWITTLHGDTMIVPLDPTGHGTGRTSHIRTATGATQYIENRAADLLGIDWITANRLFDGANTRHTLRAMIIDLLNTGNLRPAEVYEGIDFDRIRRSWQERHGDDPNQRACADLDCNCYDNGDMPQQQNPYDPDDQHPLPTINPNPPHGTYT